MDYDVAVVGAGPAGSVAAREIARRGFRVLLLEEHPQIGQPVHCSGLVTPRTLETAGVDDGIVLNRIRGAIIHTPEGHQITLRDERVHALVIDRCELDRRLAQSAQEAGATLLTEARVTGLETEDDGVRLTLRRRGHEMTLRASLVIGADGSRSVVARSIGAPPPEESVLAIGGEIAIDPPAQDMVEVFARPDLAPGWFAWTIPAEPQVTRIGIGSSNGGTTPRRLLSQLVDQYPHLRGRPFLRLQGGVIPVAPLRKTVAPGVMLVGDAAGQVKPTSGGGIYTSILCAKLCAETAVQALEEGDVRNGALERYEVLWRRRMGEALLHGVTLRRLLLRLSPREIEGFLKVFTLPSIQALAYQHGDIDTPTRLFRHLLHPGLLLRGLRVLPPSLWPSLALFLVRWRRANAGVKWGRS